MGCSQCEVENVSKLRQRSQALLMMSFRSPSLSAKRNTFDSRFSQSSKKNSLKDMNVEVL